MPQPIGLLATLQQLRGDPSAVVHLYEQLFAESFWALVRPGTEDVVGQMEFVTYSTIDNARELPLFTSKEFILKFPKEHPIPVRVAGPELWPRLLQVLPIDHSQAAIDPDQRHGIRLTEPMILGMVSAYARKDAHP